MKVVLVMFKDDERRDFPLKGTDVIVGRAPESGLRIPLNDVSRRHCEIHVGSKAVTVKDLGSANGTYVNGRRVAESVVAPGDVLEIGGVRFLAQIDGKPSAITPHDLNVPRVDESPAAKPAPAPDKGAKATATAPGKGAPTAKVAPAAPAKPGPAPAAKPAAPSSPAKAATSAPKAAPGKPSGDAPMDLTEEDLFDLNDSDFDLNEGSWPVDDEDDDDDTPSKKGKK